MQITPTSKTVLVDEIMKGERKSTGGIILRNDDGTSEGVRDRWCRIHSVGSAVTDIVPGEWVLVKHGRWTRELDLNGTSLWSVEYPDGILCAWAGEGLPEDTYAEESVAAGQLNG